MQTTWWWGRWWCVMYTQPARILINHEEKRPLMRMHTNILAAYLLSARHLSNIGWIETHHTAQHGQTEMTIKQNVFTSNIIHHTIATREKELNASKHSESTNVKCVDRFSWNAWWMAVFVFSRKLLLHIFHLFHIFYLYSNSLHESLSVCLIFVYVILFSQVDTQNAEQRNSAHFCWPFQ